MIKTAIRLPNNMVMVFDEKGEQLPEYQGEYKEVKDLILKDAPGDAIFQCSMLVAPFGVVKREEW